MRASVIIPATDQPPSLDRCLRAVREVLTSGDEVVIVDRPLSASPAVARNRGARLATGDILLFVDADVEIHRTALARIRLAFEEDLDLVAMIGSYDDAPEGGIVSGFRNLLHHHVHQNSAGEIGTFWAGLGAIRCDEFERAGGFVEHPVEDIELGMRLAKRGAKIVLDPSVQGKHLKNWSLWGMIRTDFAVRGVPWVGLMLRHRTAAATLNLGWRNRLSAAVSLALPVMIALANFAAAGIAMLCLLGLNARFYALLVRKRGPLEAFVGVLLHIVHLLVAVATIPCGLWAYARNQHALSPSPRAPLI